MLSLPANTDPLYDATRPRTALDRFFPSHDPRRAGPPLPVHDPEGGMLMVPLAVLLYMPFVTGWVWECSQGTIYFYLNNVTFKGPFGLMMHCGTHRALYKKEYNALNYIIPWGLAPFFGQSPETYRAHHVGMHHVENNMEEDENGDALPTRFSARFPATTPLPVHRYRHAGGLPVQEEAEQAHDRRDPGEFLFLAFCFAMCFVNLAATL